VRSLVCTDLEFEIMKLGAAPSPSSLLLLLSAVRTWRMHCPGTQASLRTCWVCGCLRLRYSMAHGISISANL
jgi:hypothetical protein